MPAPSIAPPCAFPSLRRSESFSDSDLTLGWDVLYCALHAIRCLPVESAGRYGAGLVAGQPERESDFSVINFMDQEMPAQVRRTLDPEPTSIEALTT